MGEKSVDAPVSRGDASPDAPRRSTAGVLAVRPAQLDDAPALTVAHVRAWQAAYRGLLPQPYLDGLDVDERADAWRQRLSQPTEDARSLVGTVDDRVAGFVSFGSARDEESGEGGEVYALNVHPDDWGAGVGSALLSAAHAGLADLGFDESALWVLSGNARARRFYERHGWAVEENVRTRHLKGAALAEVRYARHLP
jgi:GNAT superfamily N-acetyltransferase